MRDDGQSGLPINDGAKVEQPRLEQPVGGTDNHEACAECGRKFWSRLLRNTAHGGFCDQCWKFGEIMRSLGMGKMP